MVYKDTSDCVLIPCILRYKPLTGLMPSPPAVLTHQTHSPLRLLPSAENIISLVFLLLDLSGAWIADSD